MIIIIIYYAQNLIKNHYYLFNIITIKITNYYNYYFFLVFSELETIVFFDELIAFFKKIVDFKDQYFILQN